MNKLLLGLSQTSKVGWKTMYKILKEGVTLECISISASSWKHRFPFLTEEQCQHLAMSITHQSIQQMEEILEKQGVSYITITDQEYPSLLKEIAQPPWVLYMKGNTQFLHQPALGVVGSRKTSVYGQTITHRMVSALVDQGWSITSGMALGIDTLAHQAALAKKGITIAVLGAGIDIAYPHQNRMLYDQLSQEGLLVSEYPPGTRPHPSYFPYRNRIISGLSLGVLVVEAAKQSGSLITAHCALEQGREVFAIPGSILDPQSVGTNLLIQKHGAKLVTHPQDIAEEFAHIDLQKSGEPIKEEKQLGVNRGNTVDDIEKKLLHFLQTGSRHINECITALDLTFPEASKRLLKLELRGMVQALPGSYYRRIDQE